MVTGDVDQGPIQSVSTRIRLDGSSGECEACGAAIEAGKRFKLAAVRTGGRIVHYEFCCGGCIDDWKSN